MPADKPSGETLDPQLKAKKPVAPKEVVVPEPPFDGCDHPCHHADLGAYMRAGNPGIPKHRTVKIISCKGCYKNHPRPESNDDSWEHSLTSDISLITINQQETQLGKR